MKRSAIAETRRALIRVSASLAAAISLLERTPKAKKAAPSDTMFNMMINDYKRALEAARKDMKMPAKKSQSYARWQRAPIDRVALVDNKGEVRQVTRYDTTAVAQCARKLGVSIAYIREKLETGGWQLVPCAVWVELLPGLTTREQRSKKAVDRDKKAR
jgi:hypothetical protein